MMKGIKERYLENYNRIARVDLSQDILPVWYRRAQARKIVSYAGCLKGKRILDIGCGKGYILYQMRSFDVLGVDISPEYMSYLKAKELNAIVADAEVLPFNNEFDIAIMTDILEHVLSPDLALSSAYGVLKPGGRLIIRVPVNEDISVYKDCEYEFVHLRSFSPESLLDMLIKSGFRVIKHYYDGFSFNTFKYRNKYIRFLVFKLVGIVGRERCDSLVMRLPQWLAGLISKPVELTYVAEKD